MSCARYEPLLAGKLFGDLTAGEQRRLEKHLRSCARCRQQLVEMQATLAALGQPVRPEMPPHFWESYWPRLVDRMAHLPAPAPPRWQKFREVLGTRWAWGWRMAAAAALVVLGIVIGQRWRVGEVPTGVVATSPLVAPMPGNETSVRATQLLDRSKILLIGFRNDDFEGVSSTGLARQRKVSRSLLRETRALQISLASSPDRRLQLLLQQLELVLVQIANLEIEHDLSGVELVREGMDREGLLLKINIEELSRAAQSRTSESQRDKPML